MACFYLLLYLSVEQNNEKKLREDSNTLHIVEASEYHHKQIIANHHSPHSQSHDLYHSFLSGRQIWMACKTLGRIINVHILNIVRKFSSTVVFETFQPLLQDVYKWVHLDCTRVQYIFFFPLSGCSYTHWCIYSISVKTSMVTTQWIPESQIYAHHLCGLSEMFLRIIAKPELCHLRINSLAFLPWKVEAKQRRGPN